MIDYGPKNLNPPMIIYKTRLADWQTYWYGVLCGGSAGLIFVKVVLPLLVCKG
jgi:hypothetical protein